METKNESNKQQERKYCIYIHINKINGKVYIGQTGTKPEKRWKKGEGYKRSTHFYNAIQKYGWDNFEHKILYQNLTLEEANQLEIKTIEEYNSTDKRIGYNICKGGDNRELSEEAKKKLSIINSGENNYNYGKHLSEDVKKKISEANKNKVFDAEYREKLRIAATGRVHTKATKMKLSKDRTGKGNPRWGLHESQDVRMKTSKPILCVETGTIYYGVREASRETGLYDNMIIECCKSKRESYNGVHWQYWEEDFKETPKVVLPKYLKGTAKPVKCIETGIIYDSATEASQATKIDNSTICACCKNLNKTAGGYHWAYALDEYNEEFKKNLQANIDEAYKEWSESHKEEN